MGKLESESDVVKIRKETRCSVQFCRYSNERSVNACLGKCCSVFQNRSALHGVDL